MQSQNIVAIGPDTTESVDLFDLNMYIYVCINILCVYLVIGYTIKFKLDGSKIYIEVLCT